MKNFWRRLELVGLLWVGMTSLWAGECLAGSGNSHVEIHMQVLLISIQNYEMAPLKYANNDIEKLSSIFQTRFGAVSRAIIDRPNSKGNYKTSMEKAIADWCGGLKPDDTAILYLAGHGILGPDERLYLPMVDFDKSNFEAAAIPMQWIREQLQKAKGKCKLILLDTCFAGTGRGLDDFAVSNSAEMAKAFDGLSGVATLASSRGDQKSWLWVEQKHSLYTYWLIEGFRGNADKNNDMTLDLEELFDYLDENIQLISASEPSMDTQNPVLLNDSQIRSEFQLPLLAGSTADTLENAASLIDLRLRRSDPGLLMIPEFTTGTEGNCSTIQANYGTLPRSLAARLQSELARLASARNFRTYQILSTNTTRQLLAENQLAPENLGTNKTRHLMVDDQLVKYLVLGRIYCDPEQDGVMEVEISLVDAAAGTLVCTLKSKTLLTKTELGEIGRSGASAPPMRPRDENEYVRIPEIGLVKPNDIVALGQMIQASSAPHPLQDSTLPYNVKIFVRKAGSNDKLYRRNGKIVGNEYYLPLGKGEEYQIFIFNKTEKIMFAKVLVDGMNTISQQVPARENSKGMMVEADESSSRAFAPIVSLEDARAWIISPGAPKAIKGFYDVNEQVPDESGLYRFMLGDADQSLGARTSYTEKLGRITVAIYPPILPTATRGAIATGTQARERHAVKIYGGPYIPAKDPAVIYNFRYLSQEEYDKL